MASSLTKQFATRSAKMPLEIALPDHVRSIDGCELKAVTVENVSESMTFTAVYETVENGWVQARLAEIPGVITSAATRAEAEVMLLDALREYVLSFTDPSAEVPVDDPRMTADVVKVTLSSSAA